MKIPLARSIWNTRSPSDWGFYGAQEGFTEARSEPFGGAGRQRDEIVVESPGALAMVATTRGRFGELGDASAGSLGEDCSAHRASNGGLDVTLTQ